MVLNRQTEAECLEIIEMAVDHPNLEALQLVEEISLDDDEQDQTKTVSKSSICKNIQIRL